MSSKKIKLIAYITAEDKQLLKIRADALGLTFGAYLAELLMWDNRHDLIPQLRKGGSIICNGGSKE